jgi:hypothetical protein
MSRINQQFLFLFKLTLNFCKFNVNSKVHLLLKKLLHKICPIFEKLQVLVFPNMIKYKFIYLFLRCC